MVGVWVGLGVVVGVGVGVGVAVGAGPELELPQALNARQARISAAKNSRFIRCLDRSLALFVEFANACRNPQGCREPLSRRENLPQDHPRRADYKVMGVDLPV